MKLIVGLGNPGARYAATRHNVGFWIVEALAARCGGTLQRKAFGGRWDEVAVAGERIGILAPQQFMNCSGVSVQAAAQYLKIEVQEIIVVHDDVDLAVAQVKLVFDRGSGGHRGVASIIDTLGSQAFWRLRFGVGRPAGGGDTADYVLAPFAPEERSVVEQGVQRAAEAAIAVMEKGPAWVMQHYH